MNWIIALLQIISTCTNTSNRIQKEIRDLLNHEANPLFDFSRRPLKMATLSGVFPADGPFRKQHPESPGRWLQNLRSIRRCRNKHIGEYNQDEQYYGQYHIGNNSQETLHICFLFNTSYYYETSICGSYLRFVIWRLFSS